LAMAALLTGIFTAVAHILANRVTVAAIRGGLPTVPFARSAVISYTRRVSWFTATLLTLVFTAVTSHQAILVTVAATRGDLPTVPFARSAVISHTRRVGWVTATLLTLVFTAVTKRLAIRVTEAAAHIEFPTLPFASARWCLTVALLTDIFTAVTSHQAIRWITEAATWGNLPTIPFARAVISFAYWRVGDEIIPSRNRSGTVWNEGVEISAIPVRVSCLAWRSTLVLEASGWRGSMLVGNIALVFEASD